MYLPASSVTKGQPLKAGSQAQAGRFEVAGGFFCTRRGAFDVFMVRPLLARVRAFPGVRPP